MDIAGKIEKGRNEVELEQFQESDTAKKTPRNEKHSRQAAVVHLSTTYLYIYCAYREGAINEHNRECPEVSAGTSLTTNAHRYRHRHRPFLLWTSWLFLGCSFSVSRALPSPLHGILLAECRYYSSSSLLFLGLLTTYDQPTLFLSGHLGFVSFLCSSFPSFGFSCFYGVSQYHLFYLFIPVFNRRSSCRIPRLLGDGAVQVHK